MKVKANAIPTLAYLNREPARTPKALPILDYNIKMNTKKKNFPALAVSPTIQ